jgi:hypothetical protein
MIILKRDKDVATIDCNFIFIFLKFIFIIYFSVNNANFRENLKVLILCSICSTYLQLDWTECGSLGWITKCCGRGHHLRLHFCNKRWETKCYCSVCNRLESGE